MAADDSASASVLPKDLERLAVLLDERFRVPGTQIRFGFDGLIGLLPGIGDTIGALVSGYIVKRARELGAPFSLQLHMLVNILLDWIVGAIPLLGDIFDIGWKANRRNVDLLARHLAAHGGGAPASGSDTPGGTAAPDAG